MSNHCDANPNHGHEPLATWGRQAVPHGDHVDHIVDGCPHHPRGDHCDDHGPVALV